MKNILEFIKWCLLVVVGGIVSLFAIFVAIALPIIMFFGIPILIMVLLIKVIIGL